MTAQLRFSDRRFALQNCRWLTGPKWDSVEWNVHFAVQNGVTCPELF